MISNIAVSVLVLLGAGFILLSRIEEGYILLKKYESDNGFFVLESISFKKLLQESYDQIVHYGKKDLTVVLAI